MTTLPTPPFRSDSTPFARAEADRRAASNISVLLGSCGVVATAYFLGASWLGSSILGIPLGMWSVPLVYAVVRWGEHVRFGGSISSALSAAPKRWFGKAKAFIAETSNDMRKGFSEIRAAGRPVGAQDEEDDVQLSLFDGPAQGERPAKRKLTKKGSAIRIGVSTSPETTARLVAGSRPGGFEWVALEPGAGTPAVAQRMELDALVHDVGEGEIVVSTFGSAESDSGITDWAKPFDPTYAGVFPTRLDPKRVVLGTLAEDDALQVEFFRAIAEAAASASHVAGDALSGIRRLTGESDPLTRSMLNLRDLVVRAALRPHAPSAACIGARVVTGWMSTWDGAVEAEDRLEAFEAAGRLLPDEAAVQLRLAAARIASLEDATGLEALRRSDELVRGLRLPTATDPLPFVQSELECGSADDTMIVGRIAAGLCLAAATSPATALAYLEEDVLDDMRYSPVLIGRDPDRVVLMRVLRELQRLHRASRGAAAAA